jgi:AcrR family transcriptional regulator
MRSVVPEAPVGDEKLDPRARRRATQRAANRTEILDAAERVFGEHGLRDGSIRQIAAVSGFSPGAIYLFFDSKQHLVAETLTRRGDELVAVLNAAAESGASPLLKLHHIVDLTVAFFEARPHFRRLLRQLAGGTPIVGPALGTYGSTRNGGFAAAMAAIGGIVADGQAAGEIRDGDTYAIAHLYSVLINEHILLATEMSSGKLTAAQFHELIDGMLRRTPDH